MKKIILANLVLLFFATWAVAAVMRKGPYLIYPGSNTEMMVLWQLNTTRTCTLEWGLDTSYSDGNTVTTQYGRDRQHKYTITGLTPGSKYYYRVTAGAEQYAGSFRAAPPETAREVKFLAYGDTRTNYNDHDMVNKAMADTFKADPNYQTFTMLSGDWVDDGEEEANWDNEFFNRACANSLELQANLPINGCIGNHEWDDDDTPPTYFDKYWPYPYVDGFYWSFDYGPVHVAVIDQYEEEYTEDSEQLAWLEKDLAVSTKEWKFVMLHEPAYSAGGSHGDNYDVRNYIQPLCEQYGVDMVICGHNHYYARCDKNGVKHITTGGGGAPLREGSPTYSEYVEVYVYGYHFCKLHIRRNELAFEAVALDGTIIDEFVLEHPEVELLGPADGATVGADGAVLSCEAIGSGTSYQLLFGFDPEHMDYLISDTPAPPTDIITAFPFEQTWWTIKVRTQRGHNLYADPICINAENITPIVIENLSTGNRYNYIQRAIEDASDGDEIIVGSGIWQYLENLNFEGTKSVTVRSMDPEDTSAVARTVINGGDRGPAVTFYGFGMKGSVLRGFTVTGGSRGLDAGIGVLCAGTGPMNRSTVSDCVVTRNGAGGICSYDSLPVIINCRISGNGGAGIESWFYGYPTIINCTVAGNLQHGIFGGDPRITNCTVVGNKLSGVAGWDLIITNSIIRNNSPQEISLYYGGGDTSVSYSNIRGGWVGIGNIDAVSYFAEPGYWDSNDVWVEGDYHLLPGSLCIDSGQNEAVPADTTDLDGDGNTTEPVPLDLGGNLRIVDGNDDGNSVVDMGAYESMPPIEVLLKFTPQALNPDGQGRWVKAHFVLPEGFAVEDVDIDSPAVIIEPFRAESEYINVFVGEDDLVEIEVAFGRAAFCDNELSERTVTISGLVAGASGQYFRGTDTIRIINRTLEQVAGLSSHWLETDCGEPDWCGGFDLDQDSIVNFVDFAILDDCCLEIVPQ